MNISNRERIFQVIVRIPHGRVATYGQVARLAGLPRAARLVGSTLRGLPKDTKLPWHRVINASGRISLPTDGSGKVQKERLETEGVDFIKGRVSLRDFAWQL
ncbi:MGMT family protein [Gilvimarinus sp. F26214L]|uniref:MGMT family protein n=1 Tax=Gilvimarinus sp. DZF01 TaxID=3461371 RepID=UPI0040454880